MSSSITDLARQLARNAEAVCRTYLSNGRREGRYWLVGDVANTPGRSLYVRLTGPDSGKGAAGKWTDAATGEHGDLIDLIALNLSLEPRGAIAEARAFLNLPDIVRPKIEPAPRGSPESARRLYAMSKPIVGTIAEAYLRRRGITASLAGLPLRFHPRCYYRSDDGRTAIWPAMIAAVTTPAGLITGVHRTWLDPRTLGKAPVATPRRAMGDLLGNAVRFGTAIDVLAAGEGIETVLSLKSILPAMPMIAALSASHLAAVELPATLRRLYVARDNDLSGESATARLMTRATTFGIEALVLVPLLSDFNEDLAELGIEQLRVSLRAQLAPDDQVRFLPEKHAGME